MASFTGIIYLTINQVNGKVYIGQTGINSTYYIGSGAAMLKAIKKYGKSKFTKTILRDNIESLTELNFWESFYIKLFDSRNPKVGYNIRPGGKNCKFKHTPESILKIKERSNQEDNRLRIREIQKIAAVSRKGTHHKKESKLKMMNTKFGSVKEIEICEKGGNILYTCNFSREASFLTGVKRAAIANNLAGLSKSAGGYIFKYKND
jgi:group I intron endonuclease